MIVRILEAVANAALALTALTGILIGFRWFEVEATIGALGAVCVGAMIVAALADKAARTLEAWRADRGNVRVSYTINRRMSDEAKADVPFDYRLGTKSPEWARWKANNPETAASIEREIERAARIKESIP